MKRSPTLLHSTETAESSVDLFAGTLLSTVEVYRMSGGKLETVSDTTSDFIELASDATDRRTPLLASPESLPADVASAMAIPIFRADTCTSVIVLALKKSTAAGVFEVWTPYGIYPELKLVDGFYGSLERFHNVSSFVRFERGMGLPGQTWASNHSIIHHDLPNHPGFLRAAGASAESLCSAVGIPVLALDFIAAVVLINSIELPIARGMQAWVIDGDSFELPTTSSFGLSSIEKPDVRCRASMDVGWLRRSVETGEALWRVDAASHACVAIPSFRGTNPCGVLALCF